MKPWIYGKYISWILNIILWNEFYVTVKITDRAVSIWFISAVFFMGIMSVNPWRNPQFSFFVGGTFAVCAAGPRPCDFSAFRSDVFLRKAFRQKRLFFYVGRNKRNTLISQSWISLRVLKKAEWLNSPEPKK